MTSSSYMVELELLASMPWPWVYLWPHRWIFRRRLTTILLTSDFWSGSWRWFAVAASGPWCWNRPVLRLALLVTPMLRSYLEPLGFDRLEPQTWAGNRMAFFCFVIMKWCWRHACFCLLEQPRRSKMCWTEFWRSLLAAGFDESIIASCVFGSPHQKEFRMLHWGLSSKRLTARCPGGHRHIKIEGKFTKPSAIYVDGLGKHLAEEFYRALTSKARADREAPKTGGLESVVVNDLAMFTWMVRDEVLVLEEKKSHQHLGRTVFGFPPQGSCSFYGR